MAALLLAACGWFEAEPASVPSRRGEEGVVMLDSEVGVVEDEIGGAAEDAEDEGAFDEEEVAAVPLLVLVLLLCCCW